MTLSAHRRKDRKRASRTVVKLNGAVAPDCFYADGRRGVIREYVKDEAGRHIKTQTVRGIELAKRERRGKVTWVRWY